MGAEQQDLYLAPELQVLAELQVSDLLEATLTILLIFRLALIQLLLLFDSFVLYYKQSFIMTCFAFLTLLSDSLELMQEYMHKF